MDAFEAFFRTFQRKPKEFAYQDEISRVFSQGGHVLRFLYEDLELHNHALAHDLRENPEEILKSAVEAFKNLLRVTAGGQIDESVEYFARVSTKAKSCFVPIRGLREKHLDKLVTLRGILLRGTPVKPRIRTAEFACDLCNAEQDVEQLQGSITKPLRCTSGSCTNKKSFTLHEANSTYIDWQRIYIQETQDEIPPGRTPTIIPIVLTCGLVDRGKPGDRIQIVGVWKAVPMQLTNGKLSVIFAPFLHAIDIEVLDDAEVLDITEADVARFKAFGKDPQVIDKITGAIAPSIKGWENLKLGAALCIVGGRDGLIDGEYYRGYFSVLFIGDPGTGKSRIIEAACRLAPKAIYTSGKGASGVGLTAAIIKDPDTSEFAIQAGPVVLAHGGMAGIDELEKMGKADQVCLHEAMEQGTVSVAKAGITARLNSRTSILAGGNAKDSRYNRNKTPAENVSIPASILSRFDLIFIVEDRPEPKKDREIADHIGRRRLKLSGIQEGETDDEGVDVDFFRKYFRYVHALKPSQSPETKKMMSDYYCRLRGLGDVEGAPVSIVARFLEGMYRLSEAYAKLNCREQVLESDVDAILKLFGACMKALNYDPDTGQYDVDRILSPTSASRRAQKDKIVDILRDLVATNGNKGVKEVDLIDFLVVEDMRAGDVKALLTQLRQENRIWEPSYGYLLPIKKGDKVNE